MKEKSVPISLTLPESVCQRIDQLAAGCGWNRSRYIRQIVRRYLRYLDKPEALPRDWQILPISDGRINSIPGDTLPAATPNENE